MSVSEVYVIKRKVNSNKVKDIFIFLGANIAR